MSATYDWSEKRNALAAHQAETLNDFAEAVEEGALVEVGYATATIPDGNASQTIEAAWKAVVWPDTLWAGVLQASEQNSGQDLYVIWALTRPENEPPFDI